MYGYEFIDSSVDCEEMAVGTHFQCVFNLGEPNEQVVKGTITEIEFDGDVDDYGRAYGYISGAQAVLEDGRAIFLARNGTGTIDGQSFDSQMRPAEYYAALDAFKAGSYVTNRQKGLLIGAIELKDGYVSPEQVVEIAKILGNYQSFYYFDALAGSGSPLADEYGAYKVRQSRNASYGGKAIFFEALTAAQEEK